MIKQISVCVENESGKLAEITKLLAGKDINIRAMSVVENSDLGVLRLIVNKPEEAFNLLKSENYTTNMNDVIGVEMSDAPGSLAQVLDTMREICINIEYMYAFVADLKMGALVVFKVKNSEHIEHLLKEKGINVVWPEDIYSM